MMRLLIFILLLYGVVDCDATAPFLNPRGQYSLYLAYYHYETEHFWNDQGERRPTFNDFESHQVELHTEYGLTWCDTLFGKANFTQIDESLNGDSSGFGDFELGWRRLFKLTDTSIVLGEALIIVPASDYKPALRYGRFGGEASLQHTLYLNLCNHYGFMTHRLGLRVYSGFPSDQIRYDLAVGWNFNEIAQIQVAGKLEYGLFNGSSRLDSSNVAYNPNYRLFKTDISAMVHVFGRIYLIGGYAQHLWGRNVGIGRTFYGGINGDF